MVVFLGNQGKHGLLHSHWFIRSCTKGGQLYGPISLNSTRSFCHGQGRLTVSRQNDWKNVMGAKADFEDFLRNESILMMGLFVGESRPSGRWIQQLYELFNFGLQYGIYNAWLISQKNNLFHSKICKRSCNGPLVYTRICYRKCCPSAVFSTETAAPKVVTDKPVISGLPLSV